MLCPEHRNQANSRPQCSERKTRLLLLHVRARMERVLFAWNITCLYSDRISRFYSVLLYDGLAAEREQGFGLTASERFTSSATCQSVWRAKARAQWTWSSGSGSLNPVFTPIQSLSAVPNVTENPYPWRLSVRIRVRNWETIAWKLYDSCLNSPQVSYGSADWRIVTQK